MKSPHNNAMKKSLAFCSILLLVSCSSNKVDGSSCIKEFEALNDASYSTGAYLFKAKNGNSFSLGLKSLEGTYFNLDGTNITFEMGAKGLKGEDSSSLTSQFLLKSGDLSINTDLDGFEQYSKTYGNINNISCDSYFDGSSLYLDASKNRLVGAFIQYLLRQALNNSSYYLHGGGTSLDSDKYKGKWTLSDEAKAKVDAKMPLVKEGDSFSDMFSLSSFLEGAYNDAKGKDGFAFEDKDDGTKSIIFSSVDASVLKSAFVSGFSSFKEDADISSLPSLDKAKEKTEEFFSYATPNNFYLSAFYSSGGVNRIAYNVSFSFDEDKVKETYPEGMIDLNDDGGSDLSKRFNISGFSFSGSVVTYFGDKASFSLPDSLSSYKEFPSIK